MAFPEELKRAVRRRTDMRCCVCRTFGVEIHHIQPQAEGGADTFENAAPLCPSCHEMLGANPTKRKLIREARDNWYEVCDQRFAADDKLRSTLADFRTELLDDLLRAMRPAEDRPRAASLGHVLRHVYDFSRPESKNKRGQADFLFHFIWGGKLGSDEYEEIKEELIKHFGRESAKRLCHFTLQWHHYDLHADGFTEPEMEAVVQGVIIDAVFLLQHVDLAGHEEGFELGLDPDGRIRAWIANPSGQVSVSPPAEAREGAT